MRNHKRPKHHNFKNHRKSFPLAKSPHAPYRSQEDSRKRQRSSWSPNGTTGPSPSYGRNKHRSEIFQQFNDNKDDDRDKRHETPANARDPEPHDEHRSEADDATSNNNNTSLSSLTTNHARKRRRSEQNRIDFVHARGPSEAFRPYVFGQSKTQDKTGKDHEPSRTTKSVDQEKPRRETESERLLSQPKEATRTTNPPGSAKEHPHSSTESPSSTTQAPLSSQSDNLLLTGRLLQDVRTDSWGSRPRTNSITSNELKLPQIGLCNEGHVWTLHEWHSSSSSHFRDKTENASMRTISMTLPPKGLTNLGNTCFLNSTIQCLAHIPSFVQTLLHLPNDDEDDANGKGANKKRPPNQGKLVTSIVRTLMRRVHYAPKNESHQHAHSKQPQVEPRQIVQALTWLGRVGHAPAASSPKQFYHQASANSKFRPGRQEDAHEFLVHLLDAMSHGELHHAGIYPHVSGWRDKLPTPRLEETTFVVSWRREDALLARKLGHTRNKGFHTFGLWIRLTSVVSLLWTIIFRDTWMLL